MPTIVNQRYRDIVRTSMIGETSNATTVVEIFSHYGVCYGKTANTIIYKQVSNTTASEAIAGQASTQWEVKSLHLCLYTGLTDSTAGTIITIMDGNLLQATGVLTFTGIAVADTTVTIGNRVYTWKASPGAADEVTIGANQAASEANLTTAINTGPQGGGAAHTQVTAADGAGTVTLTSVDYGSAANAIATTETMASASFAAATLTGGNDGTELSHFTLNAPDHIANRNLECTMLFDPVIRTSTGNGIFLKSDTAFGAGGNCAIFGIGWELTV